MPKSENVSKTAVGLQLEPARFEQGKPMLIAGLRGHFTAANWDSIPSQWQRLGSFGEVPGKLGRAHYGLCFQTPTGIDYLCGVEVSEVRGLRTEFNHASVPSPRYVVFSHCEHVSKLRDTLEAIWNKWFPTSRYEVARPTGGEPTFFERYGEKFDPRNGMGDIEVWIPIKS